MSERIKKPDKPALDKASVDKSWVPSFNRRPNVAVQFSDVSFAYGKLPVLKNLDFHFHETEFVALVGPNGSGKTTILRLILGLAKPNSGQITVLGRSAKAARTDIGYVPQHANFDPAFPITVTDVVRMGRLQGNQRRYSGRAQQSVDDSTAEALELAGLSGLAGRLYNALSGGQRRRVLVARALAAQPQFLILDEPTANMDSDSELRLYKTLGELKGKTTILVVTHDNGFVSALTDIVLCVGERDAEGRRTSGGGIVRHHSVPVDKAPKELFGGEALKVLHEVALPGDNCHCQADNQ